MTRRAPEGGLATWAEPDPARSPGQRIGAGLEIDVLEQRPDGWARVRCSNGWEAWVDGRLLVDDEAATPSTGPSRSRLIAGVVAVVGVVSLAFALSQGDGTTRPDERGNAARDGGAAVSTGTAEGLFSDRDLARALAAVNATAVGELRTEPSDDEAARAITESMRGAGFDLGSGVFVMPLSGEANLLYVFIDASSPLADLPDDRAEAFLGALATAPVMADHAVTRVAVDFESSDAEGPFTVSLTAPLAELRAAQTDGVDISEKVAVQVTRP